MVAVTVAVAVAPTGFWPAWAGPVALEVKRKKKGDERQAQTFSWNKG